MGLRVEAPIEGYLRVQQGPDFPSQLGPERVAVGLLIDRDSLPDFTGKELIDVKMQLLMGQQ
jgi:hypothetical protein